jgi:hypothetical protein
LFRYSQINNVVDLLRKYDLKYNEILQLIKDYPDLLISNRYSILKQKIDLFDQLNMEKSTVRNLIRNFPFIILKSYNSFIRKILYFKNLQINITEMDIYPVIFVYNLNRDIKPRCELMKKHNKWIPFKEAFALSPDEFCKRLSVERKEFDELYHDSSPLFERDLTFRYSKYLTI